MKYKLLFLFLFSIPLIAKPQKPLYEKDGLELISYRIVNDGIFKYVQGTIVNTTTNKFNIVFVEFKLYDSSGALIGETSDMIEEIGPKEKWNFKAIITEDNVSKVKLKGIKIGF
jgi:predicted secreted protein